MGPIGNAFVAGFNALILSGQPGPPPHGIHHPRAHRPPAMAPLPRPRPEAVTAAGAVASGVPEAIGGAAAAPQQMALAQSPPLPAPRPAEGDADEAEAAGAAADAAGDGALPVEVAAPPAQAAAAAPEANTPPAEAAVAATEAPAFVDGALGALIEPVPRPRPDAAAVDPEQGALVEPIPRPRPDAPAAPRSEAGEERVQLASLEPEEPPAEALTQAGGPRYAVVADGACLAALDRLKVVREQLPAIRDGFCGVGTPLKVSAIGGQGERDGEGGALALTPAATLDCDTAVALAEWLDEVVEPAAEAALEAPVTGIRIADSYSCRGMNNQEGGKMSEHSFGNAVDIGAFQVGGDWIAVAAAEDAAAPEAKFLAAVRQGACDHFTTVLGPGQPFHADHLHLDLARHGHSGTARICE